MYKTKHHIFILIFETVFVFIHISLFLSQPGLVRIPMIKNQDLSQDITIFTIYVFVLSSNSTCGAKDLRVSLPLHSAANINAFCGGVWTLLIPKTCSNIPSIVEMEVVIFNFLMQPAGRGGPGQRHRASPGYQHF